MHFFYLGHHIFTNIWLELIQFSNTFLQGTQQGPPWYRHAAERHQTQGGSLLPGSFLPSGPPDGTEGTEIRYEHVLQYPRTIVFAQNRYSWI